MEITDTTKMTMDEFLEYLETREYPPAVAAPEAADEVLDR
jgi:hypothetical protein